MLTDKLKISQRQANDAQSALGKAEKEAKSLHQKIRLLEQQLKDMVSEVSRWKKKYDEQTKQVDHLSKLNRDFQCQADSD